MPAISETGDITLSAELLLALLNNEFTPPSFRTFQEFKTLLKEYIGCRDTLESEEVRLDCLKGGAKGNLGTTAKSAFLSQGVKEMLATHQLQVASVASERHPLNDVMDEYEGHLQRVVDELGEHVLQAVPIELSCGGKDPKTRNAEQKIKNHLVLMKRTIQRIHKGILDYNKDSSRILLDKNRQFMENFLRPSTPAAKAEIVVKKQEASPRIPNLKRKRSKSPSPPPPSRAMWDSDIDSESASSYQPSDELDARSTASEY